MRAISSLPIAPAAVGLAVAAIVYFCVVAIYRITFHPLAKYPGPFWARISAWPEGISAWYLRRHLDLDRFHEQYGDVVRFSPNKLSFRNQQAWHDIYTDRRANMIKTGFTDATIQINQIIQTHSIADRELHTARRKVLNHAFSESALRSIEPQVVQRIREWCGFLAQPKINKSSNALEKQPTEWSQKRDMGRWSSFLTTDVLGQVCFSQDIASCKNAGSVWDDTIADTMAMISKVCFLPLRGFLYPILRLDRLMYFSPFRGPRANVAFKLSAAESITKRFALEESEKEYSDTKRSKDFFYYLINGNNPETGEKFQPLELIGEALLLVVAGSDTSSTALSATFFYLLQNPRILDKLCKEIRESFDDVEEITYNGGKLKDLVYLRACIEEAMRMSPPVPTLLDRLILPGGAEIDGTFVPEGITVGVPIYTLHHNPQYFEKPHEYIPERWIEGSPTSETGFQSVVSEDMVDKAKSAWVPFSTGLRGCVGKGLAQMEITTALARVLYLFDIREAQPQTTIQRKSRKLLDPAGIRTGNKGEYQLDDIFVAKRNGPVMEFKTVSPV